MAIHGGVVGLRRPDVGVHSTHVIRLRAAGAVLAAQTTASEFGGVNCTSTKLHGITRNPWDTERTPGGSSGGSAAAVAGGLLPIATGGDGGGSIRIPAGFTGLFGLKATYGRIPRGPRTLQPPLTVTLGCVSRSVRDTARWFDVSNGSDARDTLSLPRVSGWEAGLDSFDLSGKRAVVSVDLGAAIVEPRVAALVVEAAEALIRDAGLKQVDVVVQLPQGGLEWALSNLVGLVEELGDRYPDCNDDLTPEIQIGMNLAIAPLLGAVGRQGRRLPGRPQRTAGRHLRPGRLRLRRHQPGHRVRAPADPCPPRSATSTSSPPTDSTRPSATTGRSPSPPTWAGHPAVSVPVGTVDGAPVGMQVIGRHHEEQLLLDLARIVERSGPGRWWRRPSLA